MTVETSEIDGIPILHLIGAADAGVCREVRTMMLDLATQGYDAVVLELSGLDRLYTAGLMILLDAQAEAAHQKVRTIWCGARPFVRELIRLTTVDRCPVLESDLEKALDLTRAVS